MVEIEYKDTATFAKVVSSGYGSNKIITTYEANEVPDLATPAWTKYLTNNAVITLSNGILKLDIPTIGDGIWYELLDSDLSDSVGYTIETRAKVALDNDASWVFLDIGDDEHFAEIRIYNSKVALRYGTFGAIEEYIVDATTYHIYRITVKDSEAILYIDGIARITMAYTSGSGYQALAFGSGAGTGDSYWDYIRHRNDGIFTFAGSLLSQASVAVTFIQNTQFSRSNFQDAIDSDAICYPDFNNDFIVANFNRLEGIYVLQPLYGSGDDQSWYKITSVTINRDHLLNNQIDNIVSALKKTRPILGVS